MAGLMAAPMVVIEIVTMRPMYDNRRLNAALMLAAVLALAAFFMLIRQQAAIADRQFLRSMIPHHAAAILMCEQAPLADSDVRKRHRQPECRNRADEGVARALATRTAHAEG